MALMNPGGRNTQILAEALIKRAQQADLLKAPAFLAQMSQNDAKNGLIERLFKIYLDHPDWWPEPDLYAMLVKINPEDKLRLGLATILINRASPTPEAYFAKAESIMAEINDPTLKQEAMRLLSIVMWHWIKNNGF